MREQDPSSATLLEVEPTLVPEEKQTLVIDAPSPALQRQQDAPLKGTRQQQLLGADSAVAHPVVLVDPRPVSLLAVRSLRAQRSPLVILSARRLEPAFYSRGVRRCRLPALPLAPQAWQARLLELAALLEPRPILCPCSQAAVDLLRQYRDQLAPHYELTNIEPLQTRREATDEDPEIVLRRTVLRGEPALEVQLTLDVLGRNTGRCVLTWTAGAAPDVVVTSVESDETVARSVEWLQRREYSGYARLIWAPDRFGRIALQAASALPGSGWTLAFEDGVDFPSLWYATAVGTRLPPQVARANLTRRIPIAVPGLEDASMPLVRVPTAWSFRDPLPCFVALLASMVRR